MRVCWQHYTGKWLGEAMRERERQGGFGKRQRSGIWLQLRFYWGEPVGLRQSETTALHLLATAPSWRRRRCRCRFGGLVGPGGGFAAYRIGSSNACHCVRRSQASTLAAAAAATQAAQAASSGSSGHSEREL